MQPKILIGIPTIDHKIHASLVGRILQWNAEHFIGMTPILGVQPVDEARNLLVEEFLKTDCTHLMMIDADTIPPHDTISKLLALDTPFASGITPIIDGSTATITKWNAVGINDKEIKPNTGIHSSRGVGASCILIKREVFSKIGKPYFRFTFKTDDGKPCVVSEDIYFISLLIQAGYTPKVDSSVVCNHAKICLF